MDTINIEKAPLTDVSRDELRGGVRGRRAAERVRGVGAVLVEPDVVHAHRGGEVLAALHALRQRALTLCSE